MVRRLLLAAAMASWVVAWSLPAASQEDQKERSRAAFRRGVAQAHDGNYEAARDSFLEAYKLFAHPSILLNLGIARAKIGEWVDAEHDLVTFLADDGGAPPEEIASARAELAQTRQHLGTFRLRVSTSGARATIDSRPVALIGGAFVDVRTARGSHGLHVSAPGYIAADRTVVVSGERAPDVDLALARAGQGDPSRPGEATRTLAWFLVGAGVVAAGVATYAGLEARSLANDYNTPNSGSFQDASTKAKGTTFRTSADIALLAGAALGGTGLYLLLSSPGDAAAPRTGLVVGPAWTGLVGSFR